MPRAAPRPCGIPGCPGLAIEGGYCATHYKRTSRARAARYDEVRPSPAKRGYGRTHQKLRKLVMAEQPVCAATGCGQPGVEMDHVDGDSGNTARGNLQMLCKAHHSAKTMRDVGRARGRGNVLKNSARG